MMRDGEEAELAPDHVAALQADGAQVAAPADELPGRLLADRDAVPLQGIAVAAVPLEPASVGHHRDLAGPAQQLQGEAGHLLAPADGGHRSPLGLVAVAGGTVEHARPVVLEEPLHIRELVSDPGGQHQPTSDEPFRLDHDLEAIVTVGRGLHRADSTSRRNTLAVRGCDGSKEASTG
jgi:hypothetical protein